MKITKVEVFRLPTANSKQNSPIGCRIHTDVGICGDGEAGMAYGVGGSGAFGMVCDLAELIIGMDPLRTEFIWETMYKRTFWGQNGGPVVFSGIAAIDVALWDIKGKYFNVPCYQLLGGKVRDKLRTYASQLQFGWGQVGVSEHLWAVTPEDYAHNVKLALAEGFDAIKIDFFDRDEEGKPLNFLDTTGLLTPKQLKMVESRMKAAREAAGDDVDIIMENHSYPDALGAVQLAKLAEKYHTQLLGQLPLHITLREDLDNGTPTVVARPDSEFTDIYRQLAGRVAAQMYWQGEVIPGEIAFRAV